MANPLPNGADFSAGAGVRRGEQEDLLFTGTGMGVDVTTLALF
jgi:hypothetical protein